MWQPSIFSFDSWGRILPEWEGPGSDPAAAVGGGGCHQTHWQVGGDVSGSPCSPCQAPAPPDPSCPTSGRRKEAEAEGGFVIIQ